MYRFTGLAVIAFVLLSFNQPGQSQTPPSQTPKPIPIEHLYYHFLLYQHHLDKAAAARQEQGKDGEWLRSSLRKRLRFTDDDFAPIRASAERLSTEAGDLNARAKAIVAADRAARQRGLIPPGSPPPGLEKLKSLAAERDADVQAEISALNTALSPKNADLLKTFLTAEFSKSVQRVPVVPGRRPSWRWTAPQQGGMQP